MDVKARNELIAKLLHAKESLSNIQKILEREHDVRMTYMELRMIVSELQVDWKKVEEKPVPPPEPAGDEADAEMVDAELEPEADDLADGPAGGKTTVSLSKLVRPGAIFSGDVHFKSGLKAEWWVDNAGRLGLNPKGSGRPNEEDVREFQMELQRLLASQMG